MKTPALLLVIVLLSGGYSIQAQPSPTPDKQKLDKFFQSLEAHDKFMGSVAVMQDGKIVYTHSSGFADIATQKKSDENTKYRIGSISKSFTATLVFMAIEGKKLSLTQTIENYFPNLPNANKITISNLLSHRSGIHNFTDDPAYLTYNTQPKSEQEMVTIIVSGGSDFEPDSKMAYSNSNYVLLSYILQRIYSKTYAALLKERITQPIGLKNTSVGGKINISNNESNSYTYTSEWVKQSETDMSIPMGAGAVVSTPSDLTLFANALFGGKLVSANSLETMKTNRDGIGMGLIPLPFNEKVGYGHTGGIDAFSSFYGYFPNENVAFAIISNGTTYDNNQIGIVLLSSVFEVPYDIPSFETIALSSADLDKYLGVYSSSAFPLKITITKSDKTLMGQATGQPQFTLEATQEDVFSFAQAGLVLEFNPATHQMTIKQGGGVFVLTKE